MEGHGLDAGFGPRGRKDIAGVYFESQQYNNTHVSYKHATMCLQALLVIYVNSEVTIHNIDASSLGCLFQLKVATRIRNIYAGSLGA